MRKETKSRGPGVPVLGPLFGLLFGPRMRPILAIAAVFVGGAYWTWSQVREQVVAEPHYQVTLDDIVVTSPPVWIKADVKGEAMRDASLDAPLSILDEQLAERLAKAFSFHPWVAEVREVRKSIPARVTIDVVYRRPVCMVELPDRSGLYAVDAQAFLLPSRDFLDEPQKAAQYPRLAGITSVNIGRVGVRWPDPFVQGGVLIAAVLEEPWHRLNLSRIVPAEAAGFGPSTPQFELSTRNGTRVLWGSPPGMETSGEASAADKLASLNRYIADHGTLEGRDGPQRIDVRAKEIVVLAVKKKATTAAAKGTAGADRK